MYELYPYFTNDGSVGLFSPEADDIYHSTYGALTEAYEKFIFPAEIEKYFETHNEIKVLDICYGIGYNTKSFLNFLLEKNILKINFQKKLSKGKQNIAPIHTNNILQAVNIGTIDTDNFKSNENSNLELENYHDYEISNETIYSDNILAKNSADNLPKTKIFIKALDMDENLFYLSPFFKQGNEIDKKHNKLNFHYEKISKLLNCKFEQKYKLKNEVNLILFHQIIEKMPEIFKNTDFEEILNSKKYRSFFDPKLIACFKLLKYERSKYTPWKCLLMFLHNIYYKYVSTSYKNVLNGLKTDNFYFCPKVGDARKSLLEDNEKYNLIFLDAFTPAKCPALWSLEFFKLLYEHLEEDGRILTYTNSAAVRNAMISAGFYAGKIQNENKNKFIGTIAVKNKSLIKHELSEYDLGLINSKAGIFYRDENLNGLNEEIIAAREKEVEKSNKISSSRFIKEFKAREK